MNYKREKDPDFLRAAAAALAEENRALRAERAVLEAALAEARAEGERQRTEREALERQHTEEVAALRAELASVRETLTLREQQLYGKKTERRPSKEKASSNGSIQKEKPAKEPRKGHGPTDQPDLPKEDVEHTLVGSELACDHCGGTLAPMGTAAEEAELVAIEERRIVLERHLRQKYQCPCCKKGVKVAPGPVKLVPGGRYALSFAIHVAFDKYLAHLPLERQAHIFRHAGLKVTTATLFDQVDALATTLTPTYQAIWRVLQAEAVLCADETPWAVLSNGYTANERFYAWCAVGKQYVGYQLLDTRSAEGAATVLGGFAGTLMVDGLTSYPAAAKGKPGEAPKFLVANCHAHARRKWVEIEQHWPAESRHAIAVYKQLYAVEREGKGKPPEELLALRQAQSKPLLDGLFAWAREQRDRTDVLDSSSLKSAAGYLLNHEAGLRVYLEDSAVPIDNNPAERAMRATAVGRKNHYGSRSRRGTETAAILYTLIESAKRVDVSPMAYLAAAAAHALHQAGAVLLPDEFKRQLQAAKAALDAAKAQPPPADTA